MAAPNPIPNAIDPTMPILTPAEQNTVIPEIDPWNDKRAAAIAIGDFRKAETYRSQNHDQRYRTADQLYLGWRPTKTWEGTKIPRSSVAVHLVFEQAEALLPSLIGGLFPDENSLPFEVDPDPLSTPQQAQAVRDLVASQLKNLGDRTSISLREIALRHCKSFLLYGNGVTEFGWSKRTITREVWGRAQVQGRAMMMHPQLGPVGVPTGQQFEVLHKRMAHVEISKPCCQPTDIRDWYWDPNCNSHNIQNAGYCCVRSLPTINDLMEIKDQPGFQIPDTATLLQLAHQKSSTQGDTSKGQTEAFRGMSWQPAQDQSIDPNLARVELIRYWQRNRHVWIIRNYDKPLYNQPNEYGVLPFLTSPYVDVPGRWAGISLPDLCETDQRLVETIINARIDELALLIHPPIVKKRGIAIPLSQQRIRPGLVWESDDPKNDYIKSEWGNVTAQAFVEVDAAERRTQKKTGVTDLAVLGTPASGGNSANRTATGIQSQGAASGKRIQHQIENLEDRFCVPLLNALHSMNQKFLSPEEILQIIGPEGQALQIDPVDILNASVRFTMSASGKMRQKAGLQSGGFMTMAQTILNPEFISLQAQQGMKLNLEEVVNLLTDTFNIPRHALFMQMTPQEVQIHQQQQQADAQLKIQMQQMRLQAQGEHQDSKDETTLVKTLIDKILTPQASHLLLNDVSGANLDTSTGKEPQPSSGTE